MNEEKRAGNGNPEQLHIKCRHLSLGLECKNRKTLNLAKNTLNSMELHLCCGCVAKYIETNSKKQLINYVD